MYILHIPHTARSSISYMHALCSYAASKQNVSCLGAILKWYIYQLLGVVWLLPARIHGMYLFPLRLAVKGVSDIQCR